MLASGLRKPCRWVKFRDEVLKQPNGRDILVSGRPKNQGVEWITERISALIRVSIPPLNVSARCKNCYHTLRK